jgi:hypothetical protein
MASKEVCLLSHCLLPLASAGDPVLLVKRWMKFGLKQNNYKGVNGCF